MTEKLNGWGKILMAVIPLALLGLVAAIRVSERVDGQQRAIESKANKDVVDVQFVAIMRELQLLRADVQRIAK